MPGEGFVDLARSTALWKEFRAPASLSRRGDWVDAPSRGIPFLMINTGIMTAEALNRAGQRAAADSLIAETRKIALGVRFDDVAESLKPE